MRFACRFAALATALPLLLWCAARATALPRLLRCVGACRTCMQGMTWSSLRVAELTSATTERLRSPSRLWRML
eukprot:360197-Chlamydomonas_euryale.AAC.5